MAPPSGRSSIGVRVRPNANDFLTDLERQLATKKKTFYVDVHANLKPANKDIAEWSRVQLKKIRAVVPVAANMFLATKDVADWRRKQLKNKTNIPIGVNLAKAYAETLAFRRVAGKDIEINLRINTESANKAADRFAQAMARRGVSVPVDVDVDRDAVQRTARKIDTDLIRRLQSQGGVVLGVDADTGMAQAKIANLARQKPTMEAQLDLDTKKANLELKLLKIRAANEKLELNVEVKRSAVDRVHGIINDIEKKFGSLTVLRSLDLGPLTLGKPTGLIGTLSTITLLAGAVPAAVTAVTSLSKVLIDLAGAAAILPGALGGVLASLGTFTLGVQGVGDTLGALFDVWTEGASSQASTARRSVQAHNQLTNAVDDEADAQREVASARREATNDLRNLNNELRGSVLNEAQAILDVQKARDRLAKGGFDSITDMKQAQLDVAKADQSLIEVRERNGQLQAKANEENVKGVEGSDRVQSALEAQTKAAQATEQAMEAIASSQATGALGKFNDLMAQLSPNAQSFVQVIADAKGQLTGFRMELQDIIFQGLAPALRGALNNLLPTVGPGMKAIAAGINQNILAVFDTLQTPEGKSIIERILGGTAEAQKALTGLVNPLVRGLGTLMAAGAEHLPQVVDLFTRLADRFANFIETADKSGSLDTFMDRGLKALEQIAEIGINAIKIVNDLSNAFEGDLLQTIVDLTNKLHEFLTSDEGKAQLKQWIQEARDLWEDWKPILSDLPGLFRAASDAAKQVIDILMPFLNLFTSAMEKAPGLVGGFITAWLGVKVLTGVGGPIFQLATMLTSIITNATKLPGLISKIPGVNAQVPGAGGLGAGAGLTAGGAAAAGAGLVAIGAAAVHGAGAAEEAGAGNLGQIAAGGGAAAITAAGGPIGFLFPVSPVSFVSAQDKAQHQITELQAVAELAKVGNPMAEWIIAGSNGADKIKRLQWWQKNEKATEPPASYAEGGYTDWAKTVGHAAILHGHEYVEPADTVKHYGVGAMKAIHEKRVPKGALQGFESGGSVPMANPAIDPHWGSPGAEAEDRWKWSGGINMIPPIMGGTTGGWQQGPTGVGGSAGGSIWDYIKAHPPHDNNMRPDMPGFQGAGLKIPGFEFGGLVPPPLMPFGMLPLSPGSTGGSVGSDTSGQGSPQGAPGWIPQPPPVPHGPPAPGAVPTNVAPVPGQPNLVGPAPGPGDTTAPNSLANTPVGPMADQPQSFNFMGFNIPMGDQSGQTNLSDPAIWPFGIPGVGAPGTSKDDAGQWLVDWGSKVIGGLGEAVLGGVLGFFGAEGILNSPYFNALRTTLGYYSKLPGSVDATAPGGEETAANVDTLLNNYYSMPGNPPFPGVPQAMGDPSSPGNAGLQTNTLLGKQVIQQVAPWATNIGGVREDPLKWHPEGLALDVMIPGAGGLNDPTPPEGKAQGDALYAYLNQHKDQLGIDYIMWQEKDHYNHLHVNFAESGHPTGPVSRAAIPDANAPGQAPATQVTTPPTTYSGGGNDSDWFNGPLPASNTASVRERGIPKTFRRTPKKSQSIGIKQAAGPLNAPGQTTVPLTMAGLPVQDWSKQKGQLKEMAHALYLQAGMPPGEWAAFDRLIEKESSWDPTAKNPKSTAYGLGQFLDITDAEYGPRTDNPFVQLPRIFQYLRNRYHGSPAEAVQFHNAHNWYDKGGWLPPGQTHAINATGKPELVVPWEKIPSFAYGGFNDLFKRGAVPPGPLPTPPKPRGPDARMMQPRPQPMPQPRPQLPAAPPPMAAPTPAPTVGPGAPTPEPTVQGVKIGPGPGAGADRSTGGSHLNPAVQKGIRSGFATAGNLASMAAGAAGIPGAGLIGGAFGQFGKIAENIANVGASFLVGTLTNGTTENPYGVTQRGSNPTGGTTTVVDRSVSMGDVTTQDPDTFFKQMDLRDAQSRAMLGRFG